MGTSTSQRSSWREAVVYQIYPWTFNEDKNRNPQKGNGSIQGIIEKLPYLRDDLGVDVIWLSPFYVSPMNDGGYDVSNFVDVHPDLGQLSDFDELVAKVHKVGMRIMIDFVPNHTSDQHEWFQKSRKKEVGYEDWYIWHPGKIDDQGNHMPPNNWASVRSITNRKARDNGEMQNLRSDEWTPYTSAWQWDDVRGEYYLRSFSKEQPDLNWSNPRVREAMKQCMRFWFDHGVDSMRVDAVNYLGKNMEFTDEEIDIDYTEQKYANPYDQLVRYNSCGYPEPLHRYIWELTEVLRDENYEDRDLYMVFEAYMAEDDLHAINEIAPEIATTFNFGAMRLGWNAIEHKVFTDDYYETLDSRSIGNQVNGNHDNPRLATRLGDGAARSAAVMNLFLPGMRYIYNGEELGLHDATIPFDRMRDSNNAFRDGARTPPIWDDAKSNAGFSNANPDDLWLPINDIDLSLSVTRQQNDPISSLSLYEAAIRLCREVPALQEGKYLPLTTDNDQVFAYARNAGDSKAIVVINFSPTPQAVHIISSEVTTAKTLLSSIDVMQSVSEVTFDSSVHLRSNEALLLVRSD